MKLSLKALQHVRGGALEMVVNSELDKIAADLRDRPAVAKDRELTIRMKIAPREGQADFEDALCEFTVTTKLPERSLAMAVIDGANGGLEFQPHASDSARQKTLINEDEDAP